MAGLIYCFNTVGDNKIYKAGHTQNSLSTRLKGYLGPSKPRTIFFSRKVDDSIHAEKMMLTLLRQCTSLKERKDLGDEWFEKQLGLLIPQVSYMETEMADARCTETQLKRIPGMGPRRINLLFDNANYFGYSVFKLKELV